MESWVGDHGIMSMGGIMGVYRQVYSSFEGVGCLGSSLCRRLTGEPGQENRVRAKNEKVEAFLFSATGEIR
eukprot:388828-Pelagomonas_calceolata.AAC.3